MKKFFLLFSFFPFLFFFSLDVSAAPSDHPGSSMVTLTPAQTVALYGTTINALIRLDNSMTTQTAIQFSYYDTTDNYGYLADGGGFSFSGTAPSSQNTILDNEINTYCRSAKYLIYRADPYQWGNVANYGYGEYRFSGDYQMLQNMISQGAANPAECHVPFSISLSGISEFKSAVFYSTMLNQPPNFINTWYQYNRITYLTDIANFTDTSQPGVTSAGVHVPWAPLMPIYGYDGQSTLDETRTATFSGFYTDIYDGNDTTFDLTGFVFDAYAVSSINPVYGDYDIWLLIACPTIVVVNDNPVTTVATSSVTAPPVTSGTYRFTGNTQTLDTRLNAIIENQNVQISQLNAILNELNMIYTAMVARGELPVNLVPADPLNTLPPNMMTQMHDALAGFTTARLPDEEIDRGMDIIGLVFDLTGDDPSLIFFSVFSGLSLVVAVVSWFIFKGRG